MVPFRGTSQEVCDLETGPFAERLRAARVRVGVRPVDLARAIGAPKNSVSRWEHGKGYPTVPRLVRCAIELRTSLDHLMGLDRGGDVATPADVGAALAAGATWGGRALTPPERMRARAILHALLAPIDQLREISDYPQGVHKAPPAADANAARDRAQTLADLATERPSEEGRAGDAGAAGPVDGGGE